MNRKDQLLLMAFCQCHGLNIGYLYSNNDTSDVINEFEVYYARTLHSHRDEIARLVIEATCKSLEVSIDEFETPNKKYGDISLARQMVCYILERFGYTNGEIAKTLRFSPPRVSASSNTFQQRMKDNFIRVNMLVIYTDVFALIFKTSKYEKDFIHYSVTDPSAGILPKGQIFGNNEASDTKPL